MNMRLSLNNGMDFLEYRDGGGNTTEIFDIAVKTERGKGTGTRLIKMLEKKLGKGSHIHAFTRNSNHLARVFYKKNGFTEIDIPDFYPDESAILVKKII